MTETTRTPRSSIAPDPASAPESPRAAMGPLLRRLLSYLAADRSQLMVLAAAVSVSVLLGATLPLLMGRAINQISGESYSALVRTGIGLILVALGFWAGGWLRDRTIARMAQAAMLRLRTDLYDHIQTLSLSFYDRQPIGELMSRMTNDMDTIDNFLARAFSQAVTAIATISVTVVFMFIINVPLAVVTLVFIPIMLGVAAVIGRIAGPAYAALQQTLGETNGFMEESLSGQRTIIAYRRQEDAGAMLAALSEEARDTGRKATFTALTTGPLVNIVQSTQSAIIALVGAIMAINGLIGFGLVVTFTTYSAQLQGPIQQLGQVYNTLLQALAGAQRVFAIMDEQPSVQDAPDARRLEQVAGHVLFKDVDFSYVKGRPILKQNSFEALPGQKIGLCGPTGAGKSTIMNVLTRYYDIDSGTVELDGVPITQYSQESLRRAIGAVPQEAFLFSDTVLNNLRYARADATDEECIAAAQQANAHEFILQLPHGYDTMLTERGANLSQGQRQMITIARAMVANPRMLMLDEATSNVDTRTEKLIQQGLQRLMQGKTSFVVAHRLSTIQDSDLILVIDKGVIVERGTHDALMAQQGFYYDLYMSQFKGKLAQFGGPQPAAA